VGTDDPGDSDVAAQGWFTRKKNLLGVLGVGTVDQALKAAIRSGHMFVRLAALSNKVVVIDEVHAYDTYMSTLLDRLLAWLGRLGVSVVVLSATLPSRRRQDLVAAWQSGLQRCHQTDAPSMPASSAYPRVTRAGSGVPVVRAAEASDLNANRVVRLERVADDGIVEWLLAQAEGGRCVAVVHNLVRRAIATHESLKSRIAELPEGERPRLIAITGQLAVTQRRAVEAELRAGFGPGGSRPRAIVVGTQVLEQSLDLDFDVMLTDLAPIDSMIQRAGRVHRHDRSPARGVPVLAISGVTDGPTGPAFPPYLGHVYAPMVLLRTWALLRGEKELRCPEQVPTLVDAVYGSAQAVHCPSGWEKAWQKAADQLDRALDKHNRDARTVYPPHPEAVTHLSELTARGKSTRRTRRESHRS
jgi:CRISPR-associated endonuclease/helicase Cas3